MASISRQGNGRRTVQFYGSDGKRRSIRLGKVSQRSAETIKYHVEQLVSASLAKQAPPDETARWVAGLDDVLRDKLAAVGLVPRRERAMLQAFLDSYIESRTDCKRSAHVLYSQVRRNLVEYFGADKPLRDITPGDGDEFRRWLTSNEKLAEATVNRRCRTAKQFMRAALRKRLVAESPFADLQAGASVNSSRLEFVSREIIAKVLDACPDAQWRLIVALARYGGLRTPSETLALTWADVDWERGRIRVPSSKTERHAGGAFRWIPLFPELRPHLEAVWEQAEPGTVHVITRYRENNQNLRTQFLRIIWQAGVKEWERLFQNLRATRETELAEEYPLHVVTAWIGNSATVASKHYLSVTDEHFEQAKKAVRNPVRYMHGQNGTEQDDSQETPRNPTLSLSVPQCTGVHVRPRGFEHSPLSSARRRKHERSGTESQAPLRAAGKRLEACPGR